MTHNDPKFIEEPVQSFQRKKPGLNK